MKPRHPIASQAEPPRAGDHHELAEWLQTLAEDEEPPRSPWAGVAAAVLAWIVLVFGIILLAAIFGLQP